MYLLRHSLTIHFTYTLKPFFNSTNRCLKLLSTMMGIHMALGFTEMKPFNLICTNSGFGTIRTSMNRIYISYLASTQSLGTSLEDCHHDNITCTDADTFYVCFLLFNPTFINIKYYSFQFGLVRNL